MKRKLAVVTLATMLVVLAACSAAPTVQPETTAPAPVPTQTEPVEPTQPPTAVPAPTTAAQPTVPAATFNLSTPGPYFAGSRSYNFKDESRGGRSMNVTLWYPALEQKNEAGKHLPFNAPPDMSAAPYPLILTESSSGSTVFQSHLATHGFVMAAVSIPDHANYFEWDFQMIDWPRDFLFVLDQIAAGPLEGLAGVIDSDNVGATGYSYGGDIALTLSGVRIDPEFYLPYCEHPLELDAAYGGVEWYLKNTCGLAQKWEAFTEFAGQTITTSQDGMWQQLTDERIKAVLPMAAAGTWLYGERGLAAADRPVLMIVAGDDELTPYQEEIGYLFEHLGGSEKALITFVGKGHMMVEVAEQKARMRHLATAFFGYYLQGREDYQQYFSQDFISQFEDLYWGVMPAED